MSDLTSEQLQKSTTRKSSQKQQRPSISAVHTSESPLMLRALQSAGVGGSLTNAVRQLQHAHGNRQTLQMVRQAISHPSMMQTVQAGSKVIQLDRLVEIQSPSGKDENDFNSTRDQVQSSLGLGSAGNWLEASFDVDGSEILYIWGHMDEKGIGTIDFDELAEIMVASGFKGCREIRLIGCNNQETPMVAPQNLWMALERELKRDPTESVDSISTSSSSSSSSASSSSSSSTTLVLMPTIYATKGPLHSESKGGLKGWWVGTQSGKEDKFKEDLMIFLNYAKTGNPSGNQTSWLDVQNVVIELKKLPIEQLEQNDDAVQKIFEDALIQNQKNLKSSRKVTYPSLSLGSEIHPETEQTIVHWNPDAWVSYSG